MKDTRVDGSVSGGRVLKFGKFREEAELAVKAAGWEADGSSYYCVVRKRPTD